jgi:hypothetical protein
MFGSISIWSGPEKNFAEDRTLRTLRIVEKDLLGRGSEKCGLIIGFSHHSENLAYFHERAIAALRRAKAIFRGVVSAEKDD